MSPKEKKKLHRRLLQISGMLVLAEDPDHLAWAKAALNEVITNLQEQITKETSTWTTPETSTSSPASIPKK